MLVGFGVGEEDDKAQRVFIGDAGRKFTYLLGKSGLKRKEIYLTNLVKCFPDKETPKKKTHIDVCKPYIYQEIHEVRPKVIVVFGEPATKALIGKTSKFKHLVGFPVYHTFLLGDTYTQSRRRLAPMGTRHADHPYPPRRSDLCQR